MHMYRKIVLKIDDMSKAKDNPVKPIMGPRIPIKTSNVPILMTARKPTLVDSMACSLAVRTAPIVRGTIEMTRI